MAGGAPWQYRRAHALGVFECAEIRATREIGDFHQNFRFFALKRAKVQLPKFHHIHPLGVPV